ncbi:MULTISPECIES: glycosyltransferase family 4 protein [unclassified Carboxylicivirga]|uniref:glycosyltransferase family 4 protein n=1 Tax=Carboxylicivirga TaxID=1628153 RepID=UPI003D32C3DD
MKIGFDAKRAFFNNSGLGNYSRWFIEALTTLHPEHQYLLYKPRKDKGTYFRGLQHCKVIRPQSAYYKALPDMWRTYGMSKEIKKQGLDIFHGLSHELPVGIAKTNVKSIVTMHDAIFLRFPHLFDRTYRTIFKLKYKHALNMANGVIAISQQSKDDIVHYFGTHPDRIKVIYQGCNPIYYNKAEDALKKQIKSKYQLPDNYILYVGTIEPRKNLLGIFEALVQEGIDMPVVAIGRPTKYLDDIKRFIKHHNIESKAIFLHNLETPELPAIYQMATLFAYPSIFEGFGIPILEAMNSGTPVITSKGSCFPEVGGEAARYAKYGDTEELGQLIKSILGSSMLQSDMAIKGRQQALKFREEKVTKDLIDYYKNILTH